MLGEIILVGGISAIAYTVADHENVLPWAPNPEKKFWWERIFPQPAAAAVRTQTMVRPLSGEQRIKQAQATMGEAQREIARGVEQQIQEAKQVQSRQSKYVLTAPEEQVVWPVQKGKAYGAY
jgi:hypothetical protein